MANVTRMIGVATLVGAFSTGVHAQTLASANAFACGVDAPSIYGSSANRSTSVRHGGGYGADPQFRSMVKLRIVYEYPDRIEVDHCGGTVIGSQWIVTAAHCVAADASWDRIEVLAGDANLDGTGVIKRVSRNAVCHSGFDYDALSDDISLIRLDEPLPPSIPPAQIDQQNATSARRGSSGLVAGWPVTGLKAGDRRLNKTSVQLKDVQVPGYITAVSSSGGAEGLCRGESGGPLMSYGSYGLTLSGVLSGIQPGTENSQGGECMLSSYEMYFTPVAAFRGWIDSVRNICTSNPSLCSGSGHRGQLLASAPSYDGSRPAHGSYEGQAFASAQPAYTPVAAAPSYTAAQPTYVNVAQVQPTYVETVLTQPLYQAPTYQPIAETQPTYVPVAQTQPTYVDVSDQYASYSGYAVATTPVAQPTRNWSYQVLLDATPQTYDVASVYGSTPIYDATPAYVDTGYVNTGYVDTGYSAPSYSIDLGATYAPAATTYQDYSYPTAVETYAVPTNQYDHVGSYDSSGYSVAYVTDSFSGVSTYQPHAW